MPVAFNDPRLVAPQCTNLHPVRTVHQNPWFSVRNRGGYYTTEYAQPQVIVLPVVNNRAVVLVRVKRPVIMESTLELPAGGAKAEESPRQGAARELSEETGIQAPAERFREMLPIANSPNRNPQLIHIFQVDLQQQEYDRRGAHDHEIDEVVLYNFEEIAAKIFKGEIFVGVPLAILSRFLLEHVRSPNPYKTESVDACAKPDLKATGQTT